MNKPLLIDYIDQKAWLDDKIGQIGSQCGRRNLAVDIEDACKNKQAFLFMDGGNFVVLKPFKEDGEIMILVWAAYCETGDALTTYMPFIDSVCRRVGASRIQFLTARSGFERAAPKFGFEKAFTVWEKNCD